MHPSHHAPVLFPGESGGVGGGAGGGGLQTTVTSQRLYGWSGGVESGPAEPRADSQPADTMHQAKPTPKARVQPWKAMPL